MELRYIGKGAWLPGVPARDLTPEEAKRFGQERLLESGLYEKGTPDNAEGDKRAKKARWDEPDHDAKVPLAALSENDAPSVKEKQQ